MGVYKRAMAEYRDYVELWIHEIKTPIAAANLMAADLHGPVAARLKGELDRIEAQVEQALYYARSTSLAKDYAIRETPLAAAVRAACRKNARYLIECGVALQMDVPEEATVFADEPWLVFVVGQVMVNAAKYGAKNVRFSACEEGVGTVSSRTVLSVADDGCGIPAADVPRVFERGLHGGERAGAGLVHRHGPVPGGRHVREDGAGVGHSLRGGHGNARHAVLPARPPPHGPANRLTRPPARLPYQTVRQG